MISFVHLRPRYIGVVQTLEGKFHVWLGKLESPLPVLALRSQWRAIFRHTEGPRAPGRGSEGIIQLAYNVP